MKRPILWITIFMICGIYMRLGRSELMCLVSFIFIVTSISRFVISRHSWKYLLLLLFVLLGFFSTERSLEKGLGLKPSGEIDGVGFVADVGVTDAGNQKMTICCNLRDEEGNLLRDVKLYVVWTEEPAFAVGDAVSFKGSLTPFYDASYPGGYDEDLYLRTKGFEGKMYPDSMKKTGAVSSIPLLLTKGRIAFQNALDEILPAEESSIMKAMLTGEKDDIPVEINTLYTRAGVVHILCISGLHMSVLALYVAFFVEKILKRSRRTSAIVTMAAALAFLAFIGFSPSAVRAVVMICVVMMGRVIFRNHDRRNDIAIAALVILLIEPLYLFHIGFQLSFITVTGLCLAAERVEKKRKKDRTKLDEVRELLLFSLYASLFSYPVVAYYFSYISSVGILANLVILPLSGLLLGFGILSGILALIWLPAGIFAAGSVYAILQIYKWTCTILCLLPFSTLLVGRPSMAVILLYYGILIFYMKCAERKGSWKVAVALCAAMWCAVFENQLFRRETTVAFLDVGQGDAAVISTYDGKTYLVDGGGVYGREFGKNVGRTILLPYLEYLGVNHIDAAFLSHPDADHMTGLLELMETIRIDGLYLASYPYEETKDLDFLKETVEKYAIPVYTVESGASDGPWECLYPIKNIAIRDDDNHGSLVLKYHCGDTEILFTGDMMAQDERLLLEKNADVSADILKTAHHGSKYSSSTDFLEAVNAKAAVISCGKNNIYRHPHEETLERLQSAEVYRTDESGAVLVTIKRDGAFSIETMAERNPLYERIKEKMEEWRV